MSKKTLIIDDVQHAARLLRDGLLVAFPTETVYGLGADATNASAVAAIYAAKGRPADNPLIVHVRDAPAASRVASEMPPLARGLLDRFAPGPLTVVVRRGASVSPLVSAGLDTVAIRIPAHPAALDLLGASGIPIAAPSANLSGRPSPTSWEAVQADLDGRIDAILVGGASKVGLESTVVDCTGSVPCVLRVGGVTLEELRQFAPSLRVGGGKTQSSPGTRHPHYAPSAKVVLVGQPDPTRTAGYIGSIVPETGYAEVRVVKSLPEYAHELYDFFRACDALGLDQIHCLNPGERGLGSALLDRVSRASEGVPGSREGSVDSSV